MLISLLIAAFSFVSLWFVFVKANEEGWKALIPFYNAYIQFKIAGKQKLFLPFIIGLVLVSILYPVGYLLFVMGIFDTTMAVIGVILLILSTLVSIALVVFDIKATIALGHKFGKSGGFIVGMILLPVVFFGILAFDKNVIYNSEVEAE